MNIFKFDLAKTTPAIPIIYRIASLIANYPLFNFAKQKALTRRALVQTCLRLVSNK